MFNLKKNFCVAFLVLINSLIYSQHNIKFCFIYNDSKLTKEDVQSKVNFILETSNIKKSVVEIVHFTNNNEIIDNWDFKKSIIIYKPTKKDCSFDLCEKLSPIIDYAKSEKSRIYSENKTSCDLNIESILLKDSDQSSIADKINEEIVRLNKSKIITTIFFLFDRDQKASILSINFEKESIKVFEGETFKLNPIITGENVLIHWSPEIGLSCNDCKNPEITPKESLSYECTITDSSGCQSIKKYIDVQVEKKCNCRTISKNEILLKNHPEHKIIRNSKGTLPEWEIISKESGDFIFDVVVKPNCADSFLVKIVNQNLKEFYHMIYYMDEITYSYTKHPFLKNLTDHFVFRIDISDQKKEMSQREHEYFKLIIIPYINGSECAVGKYESPRLEFSPCE